MNSSRVSVSIHHIHEAIKQLLIISNNLAKEIPGSKMVVLKEVTRDEYDLSGQNPLVNFRGAAVKEVLKAEAEGEQLQEEVDTIPYFNEGTTLGSNPKSATASPSITSLAPPRKFTVKQVKIELQEYCDEAGIPTGERGVFKPFLPGLTQATSYTELHKRIALTHNMLLGHGAL